MLGSEEWEVKSADETHFRADGYIRLATAKSKDRTLGLSPNLLSYQRPAKTKWWTLEIQMYTGQIFGGSCKKSEVN